MITVEGYKIIKKIGSGGMGDVYLGEHEKLEKKVAIKSLHKNLATDTSFRERFSQEAKTHATLDHPNIVKLLDYKESKEGLFLIMEYVDGKQLDEHIKKVTGPIPEKELTALFAQVLDAIGYAHDEGLVHRDIKPSNIMIDKKGRIKVLDFGIAKIQEQEKGLTKTGVQIGTASYMSPEQVNAEKLDKLTDIYSLGVTFFYMAVGKSPYDEDTNTFRIQTKIVSEPFPRAKEFYPGVSDKIETIINKATQKKKTDRYQSCEEFKNDLDSSVEKSWKNKPTEEPTKKKSFVSGKILVPILVIAALLFGMFYLIFYSGNTQPLPPVFEEAVVEEVVEEAPAVEEVVDTTAAVVEEKGINRLYDFLYQEGHYTKSFEEFIEKYRTKSAQIRLYDFVNQKGYYTKSFEQFEEQYFKRHYVVFGCLSGNCVKRQGTYTWANGNKYVGEWKDGERNGQGTYTWANGNKYVGEWKDGLMHGQGTYTWTGGNKYVGEYKNDLHHGQGTFTWADGTVIEGLWKKGDFIR